MNYVLGAVLELKDKAFTSGVKDSISATGNLKKELDGASKKGEGFGSSMKKAGKTAAIGIAAIGTAAAAYVSITAFKDLSVSMVQNAATAQAMSSQFEQVFSGMESAATDSLSKVANETGILSERLKGSFLGMAAFAKTTGMDTAGALGLTERATLAAADGAAFYDKSIEEVSESLQSFLKGNFENDAALGISATETTRNAAANKLYGKSFKKLSEDQKQLTLLQMVEDGNKLSGALGQAARETDGLENVMGNLRSSWDTIKAKLGEPLLAPVVQGMKFLTSVISNINTDAAINGFRNLGNVGKGAIDFIRPGLSWLKDNALPAVRTAVDVLGIAVSMLGTWASDAFQRMKERAQENSPIIDGVRGIVQDLGDKAVWLKDVMVQAFESAKPAMGWLKDEGLPLIVDGVASVIEKATELYNYINDNWNSISPIVYGVASAIAFYKAGMLIAAGATKLMTGVTIAMSVAQGALNAVMMISPFGWVAIAIGVVVAAGVLLYKNWDTVKATAISLWKVTKEKFASIKESILTAMQPVLDFFGKLKSKWDDFKSSISNFKMPKIGLPKILGGDGLIQGSHATGLRKVPHDGYVAELHKDEAVLPKSEAERYRKGNVVNNTTSTISSTKNNKKQSVHIPKLADTIIIREEADIDKLATAFVRKLEIADFNMA